MEYSFTNCDEGTSVGGHESHVEPVGQSFLEWPDFLQFLQICRYLQSASEFLQVPMLNLLQISGLLLVWKEDGLVV
jgi:hypothetical protein